MPTLYYYKDKRGEAEAIRMMFEEVGMVGTRGITYALQNMACLTATRDSPRRRSLTLKSRK